MGNVHAKKKSRQGRKEDGGNLLSWLDFTTSSEKDNGSVILSQQSIN